MHSSAAPRPEAIIDWLQNEMGYPLPPPPADQLRKVCRGNMARVWAFLLRQVRSERTVETARRNIHVHGAAGRRPGTAGGEAAARVAEARDRDAAAEEAERLRGVFARKRNELKARIDDVVREEAERKRVLEELSNARQKQVMLETYDQQCDDGCKIYAEYQRRLHDYVNQARDVRRASENETAHVVEDLSVLMQRQERSIGKACQALSLDILARLRSSFPALDGNGLNMNCQLEASILRIDFNGELPRDVEAVVQGAIKNPSLLLQSLITHTSRATALIHDETEQIDIQADTETLRYNVENDEDAVSTNASLPWPFQEYDNVGSATSMRGSHIQFLERQKAHLQQFLDTEDALNKAAEAEASSQKLLQRLQGNGDMAISKKIAYGNSYQFKSNNRQFELDVWEKEREVAGLRASLDVLTSEVTRLSKLREEWKQAESSLMKKLKKIEQFDARKSELECVYNALLRLNMDASASWEQQPLEAREYATRALIPACLVVVDMSYGAMDLISQELSVFGQSYDYCTYKVPATPLALMEALGVSAVAGTEAIATAEKNAAIITARAATGDLSIIPSICRISSAFQHNSDGTEDSESALAAILESLKFCLKPCGSEANILDDLSKAVNLVSTRRNLIDNGSALISHILRSNQEYERTASSLIKIAQERDVLVTNRWLPELQNASQDAQRFLLDCQYIMSLIQESWEQPAATAVDWVLVDGETVNSWLMLVKQLQHKLATQRPSN